MTALAIRGLVVRAPSGFTIGPIDLDVAAGSSLCVLGRTGSGKSLLLRALAGLHPASSPPTFKVEGRVALAFQRDALVEDESALDNVRLAIIGCGLGDASDRARAALEKVGLAHHAAALPRSLSGGQRRRVGLARALAVEPDVLLLDDPTAGLDPLTALEMSRLFLPAVGAAVVFTTHDIDALAPRADRCAVLEGGALRPISGVDDPFTARAAAAW